MFLQIHPTRREALTANEATLTRWSLTTNPATILSQVSTTPGTLFDLMIDPGGRWLAYGGMTHTPDGELFALEQPCMRLHRSNGPRVIEWRRWTDLLPAQTVMVPQTVCSTLTQPLPDLAPVWQSLRGKETLLYSLSPRKDECCDTVHGGCYRMGHPSLNLPDTLPFAILLIAEAFSSLRRVKLFQ